MDVPHGASFFAERDLFAGSGGRVGLGRGGSAVEELVGEVVSDLDLFRGDGDPGDFPVALFG